MKTRDLVKSKSDNKYRLWVLMSARKLGMIDDSKVNMKLVRNPNFTCPVWNLVAVGANYHEVEKLFQQTEQFPEEWSI